MSLNLHENTCTTASFLKKRLWQRCFPLNFARFLRVSFLTKHLRWLLLAFQSESTLNSFRISCSKQVQYLKFKWKVTSWKYSRSNIVQTSSLCYVWAFRLLHWKWAPPKRFRQIFLGEILVSVNIFMLVSKYWKGNLPQTLKSNFNSIL